jgi:hypothetical protein
MAKIYELRLESYFGPSRILISSINLFEVVKEYVRMKREGFNVTQNCKEEVCTQ